MQLEQFASPSASSAMKRRAAYALAAGAAASVGVTEADAAIVYSGAQNISIGSGFSQSLDIDGDSFGDVILKNFNYVAGPYQGATVSTAPGRLVGFSAGSLSYASALNAGSVIDASTLGPSFFGSMAYGATNPNAQFNNVTNAFLGLSFPSGPNTHYGWVRVDVNNAAKTFVIKDWAFESTPGVGIAAGAGVPEPATLGLLACGAAGILAMRRQKAAA